MKHWHKNGIQKLVSLPLAESIKTMLSISTEGTRMIHTKTPKLVIYGVQIYTYGRLPHKSSQILYRFSTLIAEEWQQPPDHVRMTTVMLSIPQIKATGHTPKAKI